MEWRPGKGAARSVDVFRGLESALGESYAREKDVVQITGRVLLKPSVEARTHQNVIGIRFKSMDGKYVVQARTDAFVCSRLQPYETWERLREEAKCTWKLYRGLLSDEVSWRRIGVRYINRLDIPSESGTIALKDYFSVHPELPASLPQTAANFFLRLNVPMPALGPKGQVILTQTNTKPPREGVVSVILDIDTFLEQDLSDEQAWEKFEELRLKKNEVFESCITDRTQELIR